MPIHLGPTWQITDEALDVLDVHLAVPAPERGAALLVAANSRLVVEVVPDPVPGETASYWHSDELNAELNRRLVADPSLRYGGTSHSHPGCMAWPSQPDHAVFRRTLVELPQQREALFPIVVQAGRDALRMPDHVGDEHLVDLPSGSLAPYTGYPTRSGMTVLPCRLEVMPVRATLVAAVALLAPAEVTVAPTRAIRGTGGTWLLVRTTVDGVAVDIVLPQSFPDSPAHVRAGDDRFEPVPWGHGASPAENLAAAMAVAARPAGSVRTGLEARLAHHLPRRAPWTVGVVGCGSVGSQTAEQLVRSGVGNLVLVDPDTVSAENLSRSVYRASDVDRPKVDALADRLLTITDDLTVVRHAQELSEESMADVLASDLVLMATDDPANEAWLAHVLYDAGVPHVSAKLFAKADAGEIALVVPGRDTACLRCATGVSGATGRGAATDYGSGRLVAELALGPDIAAVCARSAKAALAVLARDEEGPLADWIDPLLAEHRTLNLSASVDGWGIFGVCAKAPMDGPFASMWVRVERREDCDVCGPDRVPAAARLRPQDVPEGLDDLMAALELAPGIGFVHAGPDLADPPS